MTEQQRRWIRAACVCLLCGGLQLSSISLWGQAAKSAAELESQLENMQTRLEKAQQQIDQDRTDLQLLRTQLEALKSQVGSAADLQQAVAGLQEQQALNQAAIQVHEQAKVETASKYQVKLHGLLLFNAALANGALDQPTLPALAVMPGTNAVNGSLTATGRQTILGLDATGPSLWGARTYANIEMDFASGLSGDDYDDTGSNYFRLRTAEMQLTWPNTTLQGGISPLILTPEYATSYFSMAVPAFSWSGALWSWLPQLSVEHRFNLSERQQFSLQGALADIPDAYVNPAGGLGARGCMSHSPRAVQTPPVPPGVPPSPREFPDVLPAVSQSRSAESEERTCRAYRQLTDPLGRFALHLRRCWRGLL
jgi:hypothetical protein